MSAEGPGQRRGQARREERPGSAGHAEDSERPEEREHHPEGQHAEGQHAEGQHAEGQHPEGQHAEGQYPEGQHPEGRDVQKQTGHPESHARHHDGRHPSDAAETAARRNSIEVNLPVVGKMQLPAKEELAFLGGVGVLAVAGALEWPVAILIAAGHTLAVNRGNKVVREFGEALEAA